MKALEIPFVYITIGKNSFNSKPELSINLGDINRDQISYRDFFTILLLLKLTHVLLTRGGWFPTFVSL